MSTVEPRGSSSEARSQDSRDEILKAAIRLFASRGFHETSMSEVARAAHVSKALIFWHFKTKEELFMAVLSRLLEPYVIDFSEEAGELDEKAQILRLVEAYLSFVNNNASSVRFFVAQLLHDEHLAESLVGQVLHLYDGYRALLVELIARAQVRGICVKDFPPDAAVSFLLSTLNGLLIGFLFMRNQGLDVAGATAMLRQWLFKDDATQPAEAAAVITPTDITGNA
ncbi:MAG TPA: TetR/AcrR family transcriptional regulator [Candidatus Binataceae bacterium]|nr:TetR/AcrR family transcriptional regulator [Candidatus Binataceae bacterium]